MAKATSPVTKVTSLADLATRAKDAAVADTFNIADVSTKVSERTGNVGFRVKCASGKVITFWSSNMDKVVKALDDKGTYGVVPGTRFSQEENGMVGLIPSDATGKGFWD